MSLISVFGRWYRRKFSDPDAAMLLILILLTATVFVFWGGLIMPVLVAAVIAYLFPNTWQLSENKVRPDSVGTNQQLDLPKPISIVSFCCSCRPLIGGGLEPSSIGKSGKHW